MTTKSESRVQEQLLSLYLRLNGFFVTGFVVHSPTYGQNRTELDALALRLPFSAEPERQIGPDSLLDLSTKYTELLICEVKSRGQKLQFNPALRTQPNAVASVLRWSGLFEEKRIAGLSTSLCGALSPDKQTSQAPPTLLATENVRVRAVIFSPERHSRRNNQPWFLTGPDVIDYAWRCLCPSTPRDACTTTYDVQAWGEYEPIVRYFKSLGNKEPSDVRDLYAFVGELTGATIGGGERSSGTFRLSK
jgi:hypothetical protein